MTGVTTQGVGEMADRIFKHRAERAFVVLSLVASWGTQAASTCPVWWDPHSCPPCTTWWSGDTTLYPTQLAAAQAKVARDNWWANVLGLPLRTLIGCDGYTICTESNPPFGNVGFSVLCIPHAQPQQELTITLSGGREVEPSGDSTINTLPLIATVIDQDTNQPPANPVTVRISLKVDPSSGGHDHGNSSRPRGGIANVQTCPSDEVCWSNPTNNGAVVFNLNAPKASGTHTITATCDECSNTATKTADVKIPGLSAIPASQFYALLEANGDVIGAKTGWHTDNHNLAPAAASVLWRLAVSYRVEQRFKLRDPATGRFTVPPPVLHLNDASLPWGGVYDICARPAACPELGVITWLKPHGEHRRGTVIDVRANGGDGSIPASKKTSFMNFLIERGVPYLHEFVGTANEHFHLRLMGRRE